MLEEAVDMHVVMNIVAVCCLLETMAKVSYSELGLLILVQTRKIYYFYQFIFGLYQHIIST